MPPIGSAATHLPRLATCFKRAAAATRFPALFPGRYIAPCLEGKTLSSLTSEGRKYREKKFFFFDYPQSSLSDVGAASLSLTLTPPSDTRMSLAS